MKRTLITISLIIVWGLVFNKVEAKNSWFGTYACGTDGTCQFYSTQACDSGVNCCYDSSGTYINTRIGSDSTWLFTHFDALPGWSECYGNLTKAESLGVGNKTVYVSGSDLSTHYDTSAHRFMGQTKSTWVQNRVVDLVLDSCTDAACSSSIDTVLTRERCWMHFYDSTAFRRIRVKDSDDSIKTVISFTQFVLYNTTETENYLVKQHGYANHHNGTITDTSAFVFIIETGTHADETTYVTWNDDDTVTLGEAKASLAVGDRIHLERGDTASYDGAGSLTIEKADSVCRMPNNYTSSFYSNWDTWNGSGARLAPNFTDPKVRQALIEYYCRAFDMSNWEYHYSVFPYVAGPDSLNGQPVMYDGIYMDNWYYNAFMSLYEGASWFKKLTGGKVTESKCITTTWTTADTDSMVSWCNADASEAHYDGVAWAWYWQKVFAKELRDSLNAGASWSDDGKKKILHANVGEQNWAGVLNSRGVYSDNYDCQSDPNCSGLDGSITEFGYDYWWRHNNSFYNLDTLKRRAKTYSDNGGSWFTTARSYAIDDRWDTVNVDNDGWEGMYSCYCFFLIYRGDSTYFSIYRDLDADGLAYSLFYANPCFDSTRWMPAMSVDLGTASGVAVMADSGNSPDYNGQFYKIWKRGYVNGDSTMLVLSRPRDCNSCEYGDETADSSISVNYALGAYYYRLDQIAGTFATGADSINNVNIHGAEGIILRATSAGAGNGGGSRVMIRR